MRIQKEFRWEMGHRLPRHAGSCRNVHGHSYRMQIEVEGGVEPVTGMVVDFQDISAAVKPLLEKLDHAFLIEAADTELLDYLRRNGMKHVISPRPSTVENICLLVAEHLDPFFQSHPNAAALRITIFETATSSATVELTRDAGRRGPE